MTRPALTLLLVLACFPLLFAQQETRTYYDEDKTMLKEVFYLKDSLPEGTYKRFNEEGDLAETGVFIQGKREGFFITYLPGTSDTLRIVNYKAGLRSGPATTFYPGGQTAQQAVYENDQIQGDVTAFYENGRVKSKVFFEDNLPHGEQKSYYPNGQLRESVFLKNGIIEGELSKYDEQGNILSIAEYKSGSLDGRFISFYPDGQIASEINYRRGVKHGGFLSFYENGQIETEGTYRRGHPHGRFTIYDENGNVSQQGRYRNGMPHNDIEYFYPTGNIKQVVSHDREGHAIASREFFEDGTLQKITHFIQGIEEGNAIHYHQNGEVSEIFPYENGLLNGVYQQFDETGALLLEQTFSHGKLLREEKVTN